MSRSRSCLDRRSTSLTHASSVLVLLAAGAAVAATSITDEPKLAAFAATERGAAVVSARIVLTRDHELGEHHHLAVECGAGFDGSGGGHLKVAGTLARVPAGADYQIVYNYVVGDYQDSPTDKAPVVLPTLYGRFNHGRRDVSMWNGPALGHNASKAIRAAINSMPSRYGGDWSTKGSLRSDRSGTLYLPGGGYTLSQPIPWFAGMAIVGEEHNKGLRTSLAPDTDFPVGRYLIESVQSGRWKRGRPNLTGSANFFSQLRNLALTCRHGLQEEPVSYVANGISYSQSLGTHVQRIMIADFRETALRVTESDAGRFSDMRITTRRSGHMQTGILLEDGPLYMLLFENITANFLHRGFVMSSKSGASRQGGVLVNGLHNENTDIPILLVNPLHIEMRGLYLLAGQSAKSTAMARIVADARSEVILSGITRRGFDRIEVVRGDQTRHWDLQTDADQTDADAFPNWKGTSVSRPFTFNLREEYGPNGATPGFVP